MLNQINNYEIDDEINPLKPFFDISINEKLVCNTHESEFITNSTNTFIIDFEIGKSTDLSFISLFNNNLYKSYTLPAWCNICKTFSKHIKNRIVKKISSLLILTISDELNKKPWKNKNWIIPTIYIKQDNNELKSYSTRQSSDDLEYCLTHIIHLIEEGENTHFVVIAFSNNEYGKNNISQISIPGDKIGEWYLFNDYSIQILDDVNAYNINSDYMKPCLMLYRQKNDNSSLLRSPITSSPVKHIAFGELPTLPNISLPKSLNTKIIPEKGDLISIDCEFVALSAEEVFIIYLGINIM